MLIGEVQLLNLLQKGDKDLPYCDFCTLSLFTSFTAGGEDNLSPLYRLRIFSWDDVDNNEMFPEPVSLVAQKVGIVFSGLLTSLPQLQGLFYGSYYLHSL